jgi:hypothetical protein
MECWGCQDNKIIAADMTDKSPAVGHFLNRL